MAALEPTLRRKLGARVWRLTVLALSAPLAWGLASASCSVHSLASHPELTSRGERQLRWAREHLEAPWTGYGPLDDLGVRAFDLILLSHLAVGLANVAVLEPGRRDGLVPLAEEVVRRAVSAEASPMHRPAAVAEIGDHNLYASHLLLVLGAAHRLGLDSGGPLAEQLARRLRAASLENETAHARSYPGSARWPADQSVTLAALAVHDAEHATELGVEPIRRWLRWMETHRDADDLPWSTTGSLSYARVSRGCALSWTTSYMARFAPEDGARLYRRYREVHGISVLGWRGFREWPRGDDRGSDVDAGPVLFGWGTAATGIGLGAARIYGDEASYAGIERIADTVGLPVPGSGRYLLAPTLGQAILFAGETAVPWPAASPPNDPTERDLPVGPLAVLALLLALDGWLVRGLVRIGREARARALHQKSTE